MAAIYKVTIRIGTVEHVLIVPAENTRRARDQGMDYLRERDSSINYDTTFSGGAVPIGFNDAPIKLYSIDLATGVVS